MHHRPASEIKVFNMLFVHIRSSRPLDFNYFNPTVVIFVIKQCCVVRLAPMQTGCSELVMAFCKSLLLVENSTALGD